MTYLNMSVTLQRLALSAGLRNMSEDFHFQVMALEEWVEYFGLTRNGGQVKD
jgi:hypothetical protein